MSPVAPSPPRLCILADLDGTLLARPYGTPPVHPLLSDGPCLEPLVRLLRCGTSVVGVTGSRLATHQARFLDAIPRELRSNVMLAVETGRLLYRAMPDGSLVQDTALDKELEGVSGLDSETVSSLVQIGRAALIRFYSDLGEQMDRGHGPLLELVPEDGALAFLRHLPRIADALLPPVTDDHRRVPRVEVRGSNAAVVWVGIPSSIAELYHHVPEQMLELVDGKPTGRMCFDCVPAGLDKSLVVSHLIRMGEVVPGFALALGDRPAGNDEGLTRWHRAPKGGQIPFISVSEHPSLVPEWMGDTHVWRLSNAEASAAVLHRLADRLVAWGFAGSRGSLGEGGGGSVLAIMGSDDAGSTADGCAGAKAAGAVEDLDIGELAREIVRAVNQAVASSYEEEHAV